MPIFNDFDLNNWKDLTDIETDSLWLFDRRDNTGKHDGFYHGNFVPQIPRQLIKRYTKKNDVVLDVFLGSGTTAYEAEMNQRSCIGIDLRADMVKYVADKFTDRDVQDNNFYEFICGDSTEIETYKQVKNILHRNGRKNIQLVVLHPPYFNILKFSDDANDLSNATNLQNFLLLFGKSIVNSIKLLAHNRYLAVVIGDTYSEKRWHPLGFFCMHEAVKHQLTLKSIIIKNMEGNRGKQNKNTIWRYRALSSDYYIFKHEYIFLFKKEFTR